MHSTNKPRHEKTCFLHMQKQRRRSAFAVIAKLIRAFVFATKIVQSLYFLNPKFQVSSHLSGCTARFVSDLVGNPEDWFSHNEAQMSKRNSATEKLFLLTVSHDIWKLPVSIEVDIICMRGDPEEIGLLL